MKSILRIVIIDDDEIWRKGCELLLSEVAGFEVAGSFESATLNLKRIEALKFQLILFGINRPSLNHIKILTNIKRVVPKIPILVLAIFSESGIIFDIFKIGISGCLTKDLSGNKLLEAIKAVMDGAGVFSGDITKIVISSFQKNIKSPLTTRETEILKYLSEGMGRAQIASELFINLNTVRTHVKNIYRKLKVTSKLEAITVAKKMRVI